MQSWICFFFSQKRIIKNGIDHKNCSKAKQYGRNWLFKIFVESVDKIWSNWRILIYEHLNLKHTYLKNYISTNGHNIWAGLSVDPDLATSMASFWCFAKQSENGQNSVTTVTL